MAALCVVLLAFAAIEQATTAHAAELCRAASICAPAASDNVSMASADASADQNVSQNDDGAPADQTNGQRHHCCGAHSSVFTAAEQAEADVQVATTATTPRDHASPRSRAPTDLERPPRDTSIA